MSPPTRLKSSQLKAWKAQEHTGFCHLCLEPLELAEAVADHDHKTGAMRGVLHRRCNSLEGVIARGLKRFGFKSAPSFLCLQEYYDKAERFKDVLHPTHRTPEERKLLAKKRNKRRRVTK